MLLAPQVPPNMSRDYNQEELLVSNGLLLLRRSPGTSRPKALEVCSITTAKSSHRANPKTIGATQELCSEGRLSWVDTIINTRPPGEDKSTMSCHFPGWPFFGTTPKLLTWRLGKGGKLKGPATLSNDTSLAK